MKTLFALTICTFLCFSCTVTKEFKNSSYEFYPKLAHKYNSTSTSNSKSRFGPVNRIVEFEYNIIAQDSIVEILMMATSGFNEGEITDHILVHLENKETLKVDYDSRTNREYVGSYSNSYTTPVSNTQTITDPGGVDFVTQPDGTVKHVHRSASIKYVNSTEQVTQSNHGSKSQIFNSGKLQFRKSDIDRIKLSGVERFELVLQNSNLILKLTSHQTHELQSYLAQ